MGTLIAKTKHKLRWVLWTLSGYFGATVKLDVPQKVVVLITYYHPARMNHISIQVRNILKCDFVEKVVISNHNPDIKIEDKISFTDKRLMYINQNIRRSCGYRWRIANDLQADYLIVIDDDILPFPSQLKMLFQQQLLAPEVPHGFSGMLHLEKDELQYREREDIDVHYLCEVYAVTRKQVKNYFIMEKLIGIQDKNLPDTVERLGDFIVISQTAEQNPRIHNAGRLFRNDTFKTPGIANHKDEKFRYHTLAVSRAVKEVQSQGLALKGDLE